MPAECKAGAEPVTIKFDIPIARPVVASPDKPSELRAELKVLISFCCLFFLSLLFFVFVFIFCVCFVVFVVVVVCFCSTFRVFLVCFDFIW